MCANPDYTPRPKMQGKHPASVEMLHLIHLTAAIARSAAEGDVDAVSTYMTILPKAVEKAKA